MKKSIQLLTLFILLSGSVFASTKAPQDQPGSASKPFSVTAMQNDLGVNVVILSSQAGKSFVKIYDKEDNLLIKDYIGTKPGEGKSYDLSNLDTGDYTIEVTENKEVVTKKIHIYEEGEQKEFFFAE